MPQRISTDDLRSRWEARAREKSDSYSGVLFRGLHPQVNELIHRWHVHQIVTRLLPHVPDGGTLLDVGCGYGRLAAAVRRVRPDVQVVGVDFAPGYCKLFSSHGAAVCGDASRLPFREGSFDAATLVTVLMYLPSAERPAALDRILRCLRPGAHALVVDGGKEFLSLVGALRPSTRKTPTGGDFFTLGEYRTLARESGHTLIGCTGMPVSTLALPVLQLMTRWQPMFRLLAGIVSALDRHLDGLARLTVHRALLMRSRQPTAP